MKQWQSSTTLDKLFGVVSYGEARRNELGMVDEVSCGKCDGTQTRILTIVPMPYAPDSLPPRFKTSGKYVGDIPCVCLLNQADTLHVCSLSCVSL